MSATTAPQLFDDYVEEYEAACALGVSLSGESRDYFAQQRVAITRQRAANLRAVKSIVDFGCGLGHTVPYLLNAFSDATCTGVDLATIAIDAAQRKYGSPRSNFTSRHTDVAAGSVDLLYCNGVFHHVPPPERAGLVRDIFGWLRPGGLFALWENNPWNPGTRIVMRRIPFDRDAITLSCLETQRLLRSEGFELVHTSFHFYFPAMLAKLRSLEPLFRRLPLGAQYCTLVRRPH